MSKDSVELLGWQRRLINEGDASDLDPRSLSILENSIVDTTGSIKARAGTAFIPHQFNQSAFPSGVYTSEIIAGEEFIAESKFAEIVVDSQGFLWEVVAKNANELEHIPVQHFPSLVTPTIAEHARLTLGLDKFVEIARIFSRLYFITGVSDQSQYVLYWLNDKWNFRPDGYDQILQAPVVVVSGVAIVPITSPSMNLVWARTTQIYESKIDIGLTGTFVIRDKATGLLVTRRKSDATFIAISPPLAQPLNASGYGFFDYAPSVSKFFVGRGVFDYTASWAVSPLQSGSVATHVANDNHVGRKLYYYDYVNNFGTSEFRLPANLVWVKGASSCVPLWGSGVYAFVPEMVKQTYFGQNTVAHDWSWSLSRISAPTSGNTLDGYSHYSEAVATRTYSPDAGSVRELEEAASKATASYYLRSKCAVSEAIIGKVFVLGWRSDGTLPYETAESRPAAAPTFFSIDVSGSGARTALPSLPAAPAFADFDKCSMFGREDKIYFFRHNSATYYEFDAVLNQWTARTHDLGEVMVGPFITYDNTGTYYGFNSVSGNFVKKFFFGVSAPIPATTVFKLGFSWLDDLGNESAISPLTSATVTATDSQASVTASSKPHNNILKRLIYMTAIQDQENAVFLKEQDPDANTFFIPLNSVDQNFERTPFSTLDAPPLPKGLRFIDIFLDRVFLIGKNNRIYFSAVGEPDRFPAGNAFDTGSDNLAFTALKAAPWGLIFGKANSVSVLRGDPLSVGMSSALGGIGIKFNTSILIHKNIAYFLANDGIYAFDGFNSNNLTRDFNKAEIALMLGKTAVFAFFDNHFFNFMGSDGETWCFDTDFKRWDKKKYPFAALRYLDVQSRHGGAAGEMAMASGAFMLGLSGATRGYMRVRNGEANFDLATWNSVTSKFDKEEPVISAPFSIKFKTQKLGSASARRRWYWLYLDCSSSPFAFGGVDGKMFVTVTSDEVSESDTFPDGSEPLSRLNIFSTQGRENLLFGLDPRVLGRFVDVEVTVHSGTEIHGLELLSEKMSGGKNDDL